MFHVFIFYVLNFSVKAVKIYEYDIAECNLGCPQ